MAEQFEDESPPILRPIPRRPFHINLTPANPIERSDPPEPCWEEPPPFSLDSKQNGFTNTSAETPAFSRVQSIANLSSSTLLGIYSATGYKDDREEAYTPWGTGAQTPARSSIDGRRPSLSALTPARTRRQHSVKHEVRESMSQLQHIISFTTRSVLLFGIGMGYGLLVTHLHNDQRVAPFQLEGIIKPSYDWRYLAFWGIAGVGLGSLLPWVDMIWADYNVPQEKDYFNAKEDNAVAVEEEESRQSASQDWNPVVRSIGAFMGISLAIRKLPWASTLQVALSLALVNPVLWYLVDRSLTGFVVSSAVGIAGSFFLLGLNPSIVPSPLTAYPPFPESVAQNLSAHGGVVGSERYMGGYVAKETIEIGIWIVSVLFCSCVCFGNVGRRLALKKSAHQIVRRDSFE